MRLLALYPAFTCSMFAQGLGTISGTVYDASGGGVPAASVTVTESATGLSRSVKSNPQGAYIVPQLRPAIYSLSVEAAGFQTFVQTGIQLLADQSSTVNVILKVGMAAEKVTVTADAEQVDVRTSTLMQVVDEKRMVDLPLNGRNAAALTLLVPGAVSAPAASAIQGNGITFPGGLAISANGSRQNQISYLMDGGNNTDEYTNVNQPFPFPDALQEFSVQTSNYSAQYGSNAGGVVNIITKSGANEVHGDAFGFLRNAIFNARNYFAATRDQLRRGQFGGTLGGPVYLPHIYNGRNRTFFFVGYQGTRIRNTAEGLSAFVPTNANLNGDFSALLSANNPANPLGRSVQLKDPSTGQPIPGNLVSPTSFDPAALGLMKYIPKTGGNGLVFYSQPVQQNYNEVLSRIDHSIGNQDRLTFRQYYNHYVSAAFFSPANILATEQGQDNLAQSYLLHESHTFRPNLLNDARFSYTREIATGPIPQGAPGYRDFGVTIPFRPPIPFVQSFVVSGAFTLSWGAPRRTVRNSFSWADDVSWVVGQHSIRLGGSFDRSRVDLNAGFLQAGAFSFTGNFTGTALADLLLGKITTFNQGFGEFKNNRNGFIGAYIQDDYRISKRLTLNFGLRYEPWLPWHEARGRVEQFRMNDYFANIRSTVYVNAPPGLLFPGDPGVPADGVTANYDDFAPRAGFAYDLTGDGKTSLRGAGGFFYDSRTVGIVNNRFVDVTPFSPQLSLTPPPGPLSDPLRGIASPFPAVFPPPKDAAFPGPVLVVTYDPTHKFMVPVVYNWNLTLERQLFPQWMLRAAYVGSHGIHIRETVALNPAQYIPGSTLSTDQRRRFQGFGTISMDGQDITSSYNSLQLSLEKRFSHGLTILANYTYSKSIDDLPVGGAVADVGSDSSSPIPWYMPGRHQFDRGPSDFDHTQNLVASYVWQLPGLTGSQRLVRAAAGNWRISGIFSAISGAPLTILAGRDISQTGILEDRGVVVGDAYGNGACNSAVTCVPYLQPASFAFPGAGAFGDIGKGSLRGPGLLNWDSAVSKEFIAKDHWHFEFRGEFFNTLNRANFNAPVTSMSAGGFGSIRSAADPRIGQLALKILF